MLTNKHQGLVSHCQLYLLWWLGWAVVERAGWTVARVGCVYGTEGCNELWQSWRLCFPSSNSPGELAIHVS